jgi:tetratricopeptide (TPR) repeat protein
MKNIINKIIPIMFIALYLFNNLASANTEVNPYEEDITYYISILNKDPNNLKILNNLASIYLKINQYENAEKILNNIIKNKKTEIVKSSSKFINNNSKNNKYFPNIEYARTHNLLGLAYIKKNDYENAVNELKNALDIDPESSKFKNNLGIVHEKIAEEKFSKISNREDKKLPNKQPKDNLKLIKFRKNKIKVSKKAFSELNSSHKAFENEINKNPQINKPKEKIYSDIPLQDKEFTKKRIDKIDYVNNGKLQDAGDNFYQVNNNANAIKSIFPPQLKIPEKKDISIKKKPIELSATAGSQNYTDLNSKKLLKGIKIYAKKTAIKPKLIKAKIKNEPVINSKLINDKSDKNDIYNSYSDNLNDWIFDEDK